MAIQIVRRAIEVRLAEYALWPDDLVSRVAARRNQHHDHAPVRQQNEAHMFQHGLRDRRRNHDAQAPRNLRENVPSALGNFLCRRRGGKFPANPFFVFRAKSRLCRDLLREKPVGRRRRHSARRCMRLVEKTLFFQVRHHVPNRRRAQSFHMPPGNRARGNRLACFNVRPDNGGQNLPVAVVMWGYLRHRYTTRIILTQLK